MGREIRRVPPNWQHPLQSCSHWTHPSHDPSRCYKPLHDESYEDARAKWLEGFRRWELGEHWDHVTDSWQPKHEYQLKYDYWEDVGDPPAREDHRPNWRPDEMTAYQVYETVSEGTPISPVCATREDLIRWLMDGRGMGISGPIRMTREQAERWIDGGGWAPSLVVSPEHGIEAGVTAVMRQQEQKVVSPWPRRDLL